jgi:hypothetical protein
LNYCTKLPLELLCRTYVSNSLSPTSHQQRSTMCSLSLCRAKCKSYTCIASYVTFLVVAAPGALRESARRIAASGWVLGAGCWVLGAGCWVLGAGCWVLGAGAALVLEVGWTGGLTRLPPLPLPAWPGRIQWYYRMAYYTFLDSLTVHYGMV